MPSSGRTRPTTAATSPPATAAATAGRFVSRGASMPKNMAVPTKTRCGRSGRAGPASHANGDRRRPDHEDEEPEPAPVPPERSWVEIRPSVQQQVRLVDEEVRRQPAEPHRLTAEPRRQGRAVQEQARVHDGGRRDNDGEPRALIDQRDRGELRTTGVHDRRADQSGQRAEAEHGHRDAECHAERDQAECDRDGVAPREYSRRRRFVEYRPHDPNGPSAFAHGLGGRAVEMWRNRGDRSSNQSPPRRQGSRGEPSQSRPIDDFSLGADHGTTLSWSGRGVPERPPRCCWRGWATTS